jgi:ABC-type transport system substrate-binding protein
LLSEAGYDASNPLEIVIMASDIPGDFEMMPTLAESIAGYYEQIGVVASLRIEEEEAYKDALFEFQLPGHPGLPAEPATLWMRGVDNRWYFVDEQLSGFSSLGRSGAAVYNEEVYPDIRQRLDEVSAEFDFDLQAEKFAEFHRWMAGEWNQIQLLVGDAVYGTSDKVGSWDQRIAGKAYAHNHWSIAP